MIKEDEKWYLKCTDEPDRYEIIFDGSGTVALDKEKGIKAHRFLHNGKDFVLDVLSLYGINYYLM